MPVTEIVLLMSALLAYAAGMVFWVHRCFARIEGGQAVAVPPWLGFAGDPTLAFIGSLPFPGLLLAFAWWSALVRAG